MSTDEGQIWSNASTDITATNYTVTAGVSASSIYLLQVLAINLAGSSYAAGPIGAKTPAPPQGVPTLTVSANTQNTNYTIWTSAYLSWTYSGFDSPTWEYQVEDQSLGENFHSTINYTGDLSSQSTTAFGLTAGDTYQFRVRADFADGTVSNWSSGSYTPPVLSAPSASVTGYNDSGGTPHLVVGWAGVPSNGFVQIEFTSDAYPDAGWVSVDPGGGYDNHFPATGGASSVLHSGDEGSMLDPGVRDASGSYTYRVRSFTNVSGTYAQPSAWSTPQTGTLPEDSSPTLSIGTVTDTSVTLNWTDYAAAGTSVGYGVQWVKKQPGVDPTIPSYFGTQSVGGIDASSSSSPITESMSYAVTGLESGTEYHFELITALGGSSHEGFSHITQSSSGALVPNSGPSNLVAAWSQSANGGSGAVALHWSDDSNNEAGFTVERSVDNVNFTALPNMPLPADQNSYVDTTAGKDSAYFYRVNAIGDSSGDYDSQYTQPVRVDTPGVRISFGDDQEDPAFNPEIWLDTSAMDSSNDQIGSPPDNDSNLVPISAQDPLGADSFGTATMTWSSAIRLYTSSGTQIGTLVADGSAYAVTWQVSAALATQTFFAQAARMSQRLGDQAFSLLTQLHLYSDQTISANPSLNQIAANAEADRFVTAPAFYIQTNREQHPDRTSTVSTVLAAKQVMAGQKVKEENRDSRSFRP